MLRYIKQPHTLLKGVFVMAASRRFHHAKQVTQTNLIDRINQANQPRHMLLCFICRLMILLLLCIIWGNSLQPASTSSAISTGVLSNLEHLWRELFHTGFPISHHVLRKLAHFSEFFLLGSVSFLHSTLCASCRNTRFLHTLIFGLSVACIDETIQRFLPGRSAQLSDILLDYTGFLCGCFLVYIFLRITKSHIHRNHPMY